MSYLKNVGKSIGYAIPAIIEDKFKDLGQLSKMVANPKEFKTIFKDSIKDVLNDTSNDMNTEIIAPIKKVLDRSTKAAKTGKFFRSEKERTASAFEAFGGGDFNMDFDFNTESLESSIDDSTNATYENTNAIYESGVMQVATTTRATKSITSELSRLSSLTYELSKLQTELTRTQISEAGRYYASSLGFLGEMTENMSALKNEMIALRMVSAPPDIFKGPNAQKYYEVLTASNFNMRSYFNYLGKKAKDSTAYSMLSMAGMMGSMMDPVEEAVKAMFSPITESKFGKRMQSLNKAIGNMPLFMLRSLASKDFGDSFFGKTANSIFKFLNVDYLDTDKRVNMKTDIRTVPWDAESKDALVLIIPNLLSKILSAVKKEDWEREGSVWDPNVNKFRKTGALKDEMSSKLLDSVGFNSFSQIDFIKEMLDSQEYIGVDDKEKEKQKKLFQMRLYGIGHKGLKAGGGNLDLDKAISEGLFDAEDSKLAELMRNRVKSKTRLDGFNDKVNFGNAVEEMGDTIAKTISDMMISNSRDFATQYRGLGPDELYKILDNRNHNVDYDKLKNTNNSGNGDNNNGGGGGNPPTNDSFFDKMRKLIDGSYLFTKLNGFLDTVSDKFSKFIFGDDTFVGPKKSFFQTLKEGIKDKIDKVTEVFKETFKPLKDYFTQTLIPNLSNAFQSIKKYLVDDIYKGIMGGHTLTGQSGIITNIKESIKGKFSKARDYLMGTKDEQGNETSEGVFKKIYKSLGFESIFNKFKDGVKSLGDVLKENTEKLAKFFNKHLFEDGGLLKGLGDKISTFFKDTTDTIKKDILNPLKEFLVGDDGILTKAKENIKQNILSPIRDFFIDKDAGIFNDAFKLKFRNTFIQPLEDFFLGKGDNKQNIFKRLMGRLNKDLFFGKEKKYNVNGIQATAGGMFGDSNSFLYKFLFGTSSVDAAGKVNKNTKGLIDNISEKGAGKYLIEKLSETIFKPFSKYLIGDENKPGILRKFATYLDTNIANPIKSFLFGDENKEGALDKFKNSFNVFLFGDGTEKRKGVIGDYLKPATDFLKVELMDPFLDTMRKQWFDMKTFFKEGVLEPLMTSFDGLGTSLGIRISEMGKMGKNYFVDAFKTTLQVANESIGGMLSNSSKTLTEMMKENVLDPIKDTLSKIRTGIWNMIKGLITVPINAISAVTDKVKITDLLAGRGGHLSEAQQDRLLAVYNKTAKVKMDKWGDQIDYFGNGNKPDEKKGFFSRFFDTFHTNRKLREEKEKAEEENKSKKITDITTIGDNKEEKTLKDITQKESANDIKNLSENSDKSTKSLSEILDTIKNPIPNITENIKDIKDSVTKYIREHSLTSGDKTTSSSTEDKEKSEEKKELKESRKEIKSTNGLLTDIRDGIDTLIFYASGGKGGSGSRGGANLRNRRFGGGSIGRILEGLILDPLGFAKNILEGGFKFIGESLSSVFKIVTEPLVQLTKSVGEGVRHIFKLVGKVGGVIEGLSNLGGKVLTSIGNLTHDISIGIGTLLKDSSEIFGGIAKDLGSVLSTVVTSTMTVLEGVSEALKPLTEFVFKGIGSILGMITVGVTQSARVAKAVMKTAGGFLGDMFGIKFGDQSGKMVKAVSIDGGMLTGITDVVRVFVVGGNLDGISNKVNSGGMDTSKLSSSNNSKENLKDVVNKNKVDLTRPDDYKKKNNKVGVIKESLLNMRENIVDKLKESRDKLMLLNSNKSVSILSAIRESSKGLLGLLIWALPALVFSIARHPIQSFKNLGDKIKDIPNNISSAIKNVKKIPAKLKSWWTGEARIGDMSNGVDMGSEKTKGFRNILQDKKNMLQEKADLTKKWWYGQEARNADFSKGDIGSKEIIGFKDKLKDKYGKTKELINNTPDWFKNKKQDIISKSGNIKESLSNMRSSAALKLKDARDKLMLLNSDSTVKHLAAIRNTGKGLLDLFMLGLPMLISGVSSIIGWVMASKAGSLIKGAGSMIGKGFTGLKGLATTGIGKIGTILKNASKLKLGIGAVAGVGEMVADKYMDEGIAKDTTTTGLGIAGWTATGAAFGGPIGAAVGALIGVVTNLDKIVRIGKAVWTYISDIGTKIKDGFKTIVDSISKLPTLLWDGVTNIAKTIGSTIIKIVKSPFNFIKGIFNDAEEETKEVHKKAINYTSNNIIPSIVDNKDKIANVASNVGSTILKASPVGLAYSAYQNKDKVTEALYNFFNNNDSFFSDIKRNIDATSKGIDNFFYGKDAKYDKDGNLISRKEDGLIKKTGDIFGKLGNWFDGLLNSKFFKSISDTVSNVVDSVSSTASGAWDKLKNVGQSVITGVKEAHQGAVNITSQGMTNVTDKFQKVSGKFSEQAPQVVRRLMKDFGLKDYQAAAIMGNLGHESGGLKQMQEKGMKSGRGGLGWAQWTGSRRVEFEQLAKETGLPIDSPELNYMMLKKELSGKYKGTIDKLKQTTDLKSSVYTFERGFERSGDVDKAGNIIKTKQYQSRNNYASQALQSLGGINTANSTFNGITGEDGKTGENTTTLAITNKQDTTTGSKIGGGTSGFNTGNSNKLANVKFAHNDIHLDKVHPELYNRFGKLAAEYKAKFGKDLVLNSAWRSVEKQAALAKASGNSKMVAPPGRSMHNFGYALDVNKVGPGQNPMIPDDMLAKYGLYRPMMSKDLYEPWHIELAETRGVRSRISREGYVPNISSIGSLNISNITSNMPNTSSNKSVDYSNITSNNPETDRNIAITNASTDVKGLAIKDAIVEQTNSYNNMNEEGNGNKNNVQSSINTSKIEALLETIARNTGETAKKDFTVNSPENKDKKNINLFEGNNTKINPYASYVDNSKMKVLDKRLEKANIIARGT